MTDIRSSIPATNYGQGRPRSIDTIVFHHIVGDAGAAIARFRTPGVQVSSTYIIGSDGTVYYTVSEGNTPYTNGNYTENTRSITIEHAGGHASVPYTEAMYRASIALVRDIRSRHNITRFLRHRDIVSTACPGQLDVERIVRESSPAAPSAPKPQPQGGNEVANRDQVNNIYRFGMHRDGDPGGLANYTGRDANAIIADMLGSQEWLTSNHITLVAYPELVNKVNQMQAVINDLSARPTKEQYASAQAQINDLVSDITAKAAELEEERKKVKEVTVTKEVIREVEPTWLAKVREFINTFLKKG